MNLIGLFLLLALLVGAVLGFALRAHLASIEKDASALLHDVHARLTSIEQLLGLAKAVSAANAAPSPVSATANPASPPTTH